MNCWWWWIAGLQQHRPCTRRTRPCATVQLLCRLLLRRRHHRPPWPLTRRTVRRHPSLSLTEETQEPQRHLAALCSNSSRRFHCRWSLRPNRRRTRFRAIRFHLRPTRPGVSAKESGSASGSASVIGSVIEMCACILIRPIRRSRIPYLLRNPYQGTSFFSFFFSIFFSIFFHFFHFFSFFFIFQFFSFFFIFQFFSFFSFFFIFQFFSFFFIFFSIFFQFFQFFFNFNLIFNLILLLMAWSFNLIQLTHSEIEKWSDLIL